MTPQKARSANAGIDLCGALAGLRRGETESEGRLLISRLFTDCPGTRTWYNCWAPDCPGNRRIRTATHPLVSLDTSVGTLKLLREDKPRPRQARSAGGELLDRAYLVILEREAGNSVEEIALGYTNSVDYEVGRIGREDQIRTDINAAMRAEGFVDGERLTHINRFYPLIEAPELKGNGVGTAVLAHMTGELEKEGIPGAFATTVSDEMARLLDRNSFGRREGIPFRAFKASLRPH